MVSPRAFHGGWRRLGAAIALAGLGAATVLAQTQTPAGDLALDHSQILRFAAVGVVGGGNDVLIQGFTVSGGTGKRLLLRAVGRDVENVAGESGDRRALSDPTIEIWRSGTGLVAENDDWTTLDPEVRRVMAQQTALPLLADEGVRPLQFNDEAAAVVAVFPPGDYSVVVRSARRDTGVAQVELFDLQAGSGELIALATRGRAGAVKDGLVTGFAVAGPSDLALLVRAIGPQLRAFGVTDALADPRLDVSTALGAVIGANDNWDPSDRILADATARSGAFPLEPGSKDAAQVVTVAAGSYTATARAAAGTSGTTLVQVSGIEPRSDISKTAPAATLAVKSFSVGMVKEPTGYVFQPRLEVTETSGKSAATVASLLFYLDQPYVPVLRNHRVEPGGSAELLWERNGRFEVELDRPYEAPAATVVISFRDDAGRTGSISAITAVTREFPLPAKTATSPQLAIESFVVTSSRQDAWYNFQPRIRVVETTGADTAVVSKIEFALDDRAASPWPVAKRVTAGAAVDLNVDVTGGPEFELSSLAPATLISVTITYAGSDGRVRTLLGKAPVRL